MPVIFFGIASFLLNVLIGRLVDAQREQIAALKALISIGADRRALPEIRGSICAIGAVLGADRLHGTARHDRAYRPFFRFPRSATHHAALGAAARDRRQRRDGGGWSNHGGSTGAAVEAGRGDATADPGGVQPLDHRAVAASGGEDDDPRLARSPATVGDDDLRTGLRGADGGAGSVLVGCLGPMVRVQFDAIERADAVVTFTDARSRRALQEIAAVDGVSLAEGQRIVPVKLRTGNRTYRPPTDRHRGGQPTCVPRTSTLAPALIPTEGPLSKGLAERLGVAAGDDLLVETLEAGGRAAAFLLRRWSRTCSATTPI
ncbi:MAG: hypothetical protein MZV49_07075 [Rhodopseudomonas palustris]|nr:hypothetical protein [Rhodopseudomonas palustris]